MTRLLDLTVREIRDVANGIRAFELVHADGGDLPAFTAGAHLDVHVPNGVVRQYSLVNDERECHRYLIAVQRETAGRGGSAAMHERLVPGMRIAAGEPRNHFALDRTVSETILIAGGIGVTPILAMARALAREGRSFVFHYATRSIARTAFRDEIAASPFAARVHFYHDDGPIDQRFDAAKAVAAAPSGAHVYLCGPAGFMAAVLDAFAARTDVKIHTEYFAAPVVPAFPSDTGNFSVQLKRSGRTVTVSSGRSILEVLREAGIEVETSCESGVCGTCLTSVLAGEPEHHDYFLSPDEKAACDRMLVCVSLAKPGSTLVLDL